MRACAGRRKARPASWPPAPHRIFRHLRSPIAAGSGRPSSRSKGKVRWEILDRALREARRHGQALAIRLMPYDQRHPLPEWYPKVGARRANSRKTKRSGSRTSRTPSTSNTGASWWGGRRALRRAPAIWTSVDISSVGYWGEGWSDLHARLPLPEGAHRHLARGLQAHAAADELRRAAGARLRHRAGRGLAPRLPGRHARSPAAWCHMLDFYPRADRARGDPGRVAALPGVARDLRGAGRPGSGRAATWTTSWRRRCGGTCPR